MPKWIWQLPKKTLNFQEKRFLAYIWWCYDKGCHDWNWSLASRFKVHRRTIKRWLFKVKKLRLVNVQSPGLKTRTIYRMPYFSREMWLLKSGLKDPHPCGTKMSHIYNAQHSKSYTTAFTMHAKKEPPTAKEFSSTTQGDSVPLKPPERKLHGNDGGSGRKKQKLSLIQSLKKHQAEFNTLRGQIGNNKDAFRIFRAAYEMEVLDQDYVWSMNLETNAKEIRIPIGVT